mmetsp:Transcript_5591/g.8592  ORF Transcript_5591/g.8592 Transcript_5591/m.8592 type:complete len:109 (-) Transcript_5591:1386-1712(-)
MSEELKPGQKFPTPTPGFGDRVFYETLYRQKPDSEMAQEWCVHYGVLPYNEAKKIHERLLRKKGKKGGAASPTRGTVKKKKVKVEPEVPVEADFEMGGAERVGSSTMI